MAILYNNIIAAKAALVLVAPKATTASVGSKIVSGTAPCEANVTITIDGKAYTAVADEVTGKWSVTANSNLTSSSTIKTACTRNSLTSATRSYTLSNGDISEGGDNNKNGWVKEGTIWYYYDATGNKVTGWNEIDGKWYYMNATGAMQTGWQKVSGKWYYLNAYGIMQTGWQKVSGKWYYLNSSGVMQTGWKCIGNKWYYLNSSGVMQSSKWISGKYYVKADGSMAVNEWVDGGRYYVDGNGKWVPNP